MVKKIFPIVIAFLMFGCAKDTELKDQKASPTLMSKQEIFDFISNDLKVKQQPFDWKTASDILIYSAGVQSDGVFSIGYQPAGFQDLKNKIHLIDLNDKTWVATRDKIKTLIYQYEGIKTNQEGVNIIAPDDYKFPQIFTLIKNPDLISKLRSMPEVRFVEPTGYHLSPEAVERSGSGCNGDPSTNVNTADYTVLSPSSKRPWNFLNHNIPTAWAQGKGAGVTLCIIDSGASPNQDNLGSQFTSGNSAGRTVEKVSTLWAGALWWAYLTSPDDECGHGTSMCGLATAPWSNDGNATGVAYKANLLSIKAVEDVLINTTNETNGVRDALYLAGNRPAVKVISMSIGSPFSSSTVTDGIYYAYNQGKMLFAAGGTSFSWTTWYGVIFPAWLPECNAITGVKDGTANVKCDVCHQGAEIDFTIVMERASDPNRNSLGLAMYSNDPKYIGGSSAATATAAGIAALMWSKTPTATRAQIFNALKNTAQFYPSKDSNLGWGKINASAAISSI